MRAALRAVAAPGSAASSTVGVSANTSSNALRWRTLGRKVSPAAINIASGVSLCTRNSSVDGSATGSISNSGAARRAAKRPAWIIESTPGKTTSRSCLRSSATIRKDYRQIYSYASAYHCHGNRVSNLQVRESMLHLVHVVNQVAVDRQHQVTHQHPRCSGRRIGFHVQHQQSLVDACGE